jgi:Putative Actinobacterial Holin-X, holin superfamily III
MPENLQADPQPGVAKLVGGILEDAQKLVRQEVGLAQREVVQAWDKARTGAALLGSALAVFCVAGVMLSFMVVKLLQQYLLPGHEWACFGIVAVLMATLGAPLICWGLKQVSEVQVSLPQTVQILDEDAQAVSDSVSKGRYSVDTLLKR